MDITKLLKLANRETVKKKKLTFELRNQLSNNLTIIKKITEL